MKKVIAILLAVVLVAGGLGGFAYAVEPANEVHAGFLTHWHYNVPGDDFWNGEVEGEKSWHTGLDNWLDDSGEPVNGVTLTLQSSQEFDYMNPDPDSTNPPTWSFGTVDQGSSVGAQVGSVSGFFTPGFDASRSANTVFTAPDTQVLTINVTPQAEEPSNYGIDIFTSESPLVSTVIASVTTSEGYNTQVSQDGPNVHIEVMDLGIPNTFTATVEIQVTPNVPEVEYMPGVGVSRVLHWPLDTITGDSVELTAEEIGTWTWSAEGDYEWLVHQTGGTTAYNLTWQPLYREIVEPIPHEPMTGQKLVGFGQYGTVKGYGMHTMFTFTNPDCVSKITIDRVSIFAFDGTALYEGPLKVGKPGDEDPNLEPHEVDAVELHDYIEPQDPLMPVTVEIFWSGAKEGLPLTGWQLTVMGKQDAGGNLIEMTSSESPMVNMEQVLEPKVEKEVTTLRLQTWHQPDDPFMQPLENFAQAVAERSGGSVQVELYPAVPLGEIAEAVRQGEVEMGLMYSTVLQYSPSVMDASQLPFLYNDDDGLMTAVQAGIGDLMSEALQEPNITVLDWTTMGLSHLFSRETMLDEPSDVAGLKIRVPNLVIRAEAISEWGGEPVTMSLAEVYTALEIEVIDGAALPLHAYDAFKLYEVAPNFCVDYAFGGLAGLGINSDVWNSLDAKTQDDIAKAAGDYVVEMLETVKLVDEAALETIQGYGVEVKVLTPEERLVWREASQPVWEWWLEELGDARPVGEEIIAIALEHNPLLAPPKALRLQTWLAPDDPLMQPLENFANTVNSQSDLVRIEVYPSDALVPNNELAEAVRQGTVEMGLLYSVTLQDSPSVMDAPQLPFLYNDEDGLMAAVQAGIGDLMTEQIKDMTVLDWTTLGFSHLCSREVMLDDLGDLTQDVKIRTPGIHGEPGGVQWEAITEWGGEPITAPMREIYELLKKGDIDGTIHSPSTYEMLKLYEVAPYFCVDYAFASLAGLCINNDVWKDMDKNTQQIITTAAGDYAEEMLETVKLVDADAIQWIKDYGVTVYELSPAERAIWREASLPVWDDWALQVVDVGQQIIDIALEHNPLPEP